MMLMNEVKKRRAVKGDTSIHLPGDILCCIFPRLPAKSLLRFQSVSKPWNAIITDNEFKRIHCKVFSREKLLLQRITGHFELIDLESAHLVFSIKKQLCPQKIFELAEVPCSCDGLVLLKNKDYRYYVLWNPSTRECRTVVCSYLKRNKRPSACGICYDSTVHDYKVILIYQSFYAVYSLNKNSWSIKKTNFACPLLSLSNNSFYQGVSTEGCVFWSPALNGRIDEYVYRKSAIIYFDVKTHELKRLSKPEFVGEGDFFRLTSVKGCLSLYGGKIQSKELDIWIMEQDGCWKWLMNICKLLTSCRSFVKNSKLLWCSENGEIIFEGWFANCQYFMYNKEGFFKIIDMPEYSHYDYRPMAASICVDNLFSLRLPIKEEGRDSTI